MRIAPSKSVVRVNREVHLSHSSWQPPEPIGSRASTSQVNSWSDLRQIVWLPSRRFSSAAPVYRARAALLLALAIALVGALAASEASADLRTGSASVQFGEQSTSPTMPKLKLFRISVDTTTGTVEGTVTFSTPLADPSTTSALRRAAADIRLGDWRDTTCGVVDGNPFEINIPLDDPSKAQLDRFGDDSVDQAFENAPVVAAMSTDRSSVSFSVTSQALVGFNIICSSATVYRGDVGIMSGTDDFFLDGFDNHDGDVAGAATNVLEMSTYSFELHLNTRSRRRIDIQRLVCKRSPSLFLEANCSARARLLGVTGAPTLRFSGILSIAELPFWEFHGKTSLSWRKCPRRHVPRRKNGRPCRVATIAHSESLINSFAGKLKWDPRLPD